MILVSEVNLLILIVEVGMYAYACVFVCDRERACIEIVIIFRF